ncbi:MAG: hypothetical protein WCF12_07835 [Propionicimonas sp.]
MIVKVLPRKGGPTRASARKLMAYLLGPGDQLTTGAGNRHTDPMVVAGWDPARNRAWAQQCTAVDWDDPQKAWRVLRELGNRIGGEACTGVALEAAGQARNLVWHTVMAAHPDDGMLTDAQWQAIAQRLLHETGLHPDGAGDPVPWVAVRHGTNEAGADHIHVMAVLVRPDGRRASTHNDVFAAQAAARWAEREYGLVPGRGRTSPNAPAEGIRADRPSRRGDMAATAKADPPYARPAGMTEPMWDRVRAEGRDRMWTRQGRTRAAVLSAAARAISAEHLIALVEAQGYQVRLRHSQNNPDQVTGWSVVAPPDRGARHPKAYAGRQLGSDCTWPALIAHIDAKAMSGGLRIVDEQEGQAMIDRAEMAAAGWGVEFIERVIAADHALIAAGPGADPALAYWLRDVFWQVAWTVERSQGRHGVWSDAAYLYSAIAATGGVPAPPAEVRAALATLHAHYDTARRYLDQIGEDLTANDAEAGAMTAHGDAVDRWADSLSARPHIPKYLTSPGGAQYVGTAAVAIALTTADIKTHTAALRTARAVHADHAARRRQLGADARAAGHYLDADLGPWLAAAKQYEARLLAALDDHQQAAIQWREAAGRLLAQAQAAGDQEAAQRVVGLDNRYRHRTPTART